jgi:FkbM family methyltransferase
MALSLKNIVRQILPNGISEYSIRRHAYLRMGIPETQASFMALRRAPYAAIREARLDLLPTEITSRLRTCVDAGAHAGTWTQALLLAFRPDLVLLVECEPRLVGRLKNTIGKIPGAEIVDAALSGEDGSADFYQLRHPAGSSLLKPRDEITQQFERDSWDVVGQARVKTVSYDRLVQFQEEVSILKLDIQGAENRVLRDSESGLRKTKAIIMEVLFVSHYEDDSTFPQLHELMRRKGFGLYRLSDAYHRGGRALFADAVYIREEILQSLSLPSTQ